MAYQITDKCVACGLCKDACPVEAINEGSPLYTIDADKCIDCAAGRACLEACPKQMFEVITVAIDQNDDNPQLIFESINSTGAPLSSGDKIRNYSLMLKSEAARRLGITRKTLRKKLDKYESAD